MSDIAKNRLIEERKALQKDKPAGMYARPMKNKDGSVNLFKWELGIKPKDGSMYSLPDDGTYRVILDIPERFPVKAPSVRFDPPVFHCNLFKDGKCCLSILLEEGHHGGRDGLSFWTPALTIRHIMLGLQQFLEEPNSESIANAEACTLLRQSRAKYEEKVKQEAQGYAKKLQEAVEKEKPAG